MEVSAGDLGITCLAWFWGEGGGEELISVSQRSFFFLVFLLIYLMLPHSMVVSP